MRTPYAIFCSDPLSPRQVDPSFSAEAETARAIGFEILLVDHDELDVRVDVTAALRRIPKALAGEAIYRGWMLRSEAYRAFHDELAARGVMMMTSPSQYDDCHHAPASYPALSEWLPPAAFVARNDVRNRGAIDRALSIFGSSPVILKDWVKSQASGYWKEACFIPDASKSDDVMSVVARFLELQGDSLTGGLVFKRYIPLEPQGQEPHEYRAFLINGEVVGCWPRSLAAHHLKPPPLSIIRAVAARLPSHFASADFGMGTDGQWHLLEIGDGQVSGLPDIIYADQLYGALHRHLTGACGNPSPS